MADEQLRLERTFAAPPEDVFDAWTNPEVLRRWWAAQPSWTCPGCDVDLRVGGRYALRMEDDDGKTHVVGGEFHEVVRPRRLVYSWCWEGADGLHPGHVSVVRVDFEPVDAGTRVLLEHTGLATGESAAQHAHGWNGVLDNLERRIFGNADL